MDRLIVLACLKVIDFNRRRINIKRDRWNSFTTGNTAENACIRTKIPDLIGLGINNQVHPAFFSFEVKAESV